jgi:uncharacterized protein YnzC (UPF0291/DUF896 family)
VKVRILEQKMLVELQIEEKTAEIEASAKTASYRQSYMEGFTDALTELLATIEEIEMQDVEDHLTDSQKAQLDNQREEYEE